MLMSSIKWNNSHYQKFIRFLGALLCLRASSASLSIPRLPKRNRRLRNDELHFRPKHKKKIRKAINKKNLEKILKQQKKTPKREESKKSEISSIPKVYQSSGFSDSEKANSDIFANVRYSGKEYQEAIQRFRKVNDQEETKQHHEKNM